MKNSQLTLEHALYVAALALAVGLRFLHLGALPLSDYEANWALQSLRVVQGLRPAIGPNPAYVHLTAIVFYMFSATNFLARFWPALAGTLLVLAPWGLRGRIGRGAALVLAFGLAIDPGLVAMSRLAGGPMLAISSLSLAGLMWMNGKRSGAGFFAGLALLSGPSIWFGLLGLALAWGLVALLKKKKIEPAGLPVDGEMEASPATDTRLPRESLRGPLAWLLGTLLVLGSLLILSPKGLPAFVLSLGTSLSGWWTLSDTPIWKPLLALPAYELLPLGFGIAAAVRGILKRDRDSILLGIWALVALVLALIYPGKQTYDLTWALLPLWTLAAIELAHHFDFEGRNMWEIAGLGVLIMALLIFGWLNLAGLTKMDLTTDTAHMHLLLLAAVVLLVGLSIVLVGAGWSADAARLGGVWAGVLALGLFSLAMSTGAAGLRQPLTVELWQPEPRTGRVDVLLKVANQISDLNKGTDGQLPLTIQGVDSTALEWLFHNWQVTTVSTLAPDSTPEMVISPISQVSLGATYRGEALPLREVPDWDHATTSNWLTWLVYRQMPVLREDVILWVRDDLMLDSQGLPPTQTNP